ncbi:AMP-binding protein [Streptomyces sp. M19]
MMPTYLSPLRRSRPSGKVVLRWRPPPSPRDHRRACRALAAEHPESTAVSCVAPDGTVSALSWREVESLSNTAARGLAEHGVTPRTTVAVALPTGTDHVVATLAAWKLGATVVPSTRTRRGPSAARSPRPSASTCSSATATGRRSGRAGGTRVATTTARSHPGSARSATLTGGTTGRPRRSCGPARGRTGPAGGSASATAPRDADRPDPTAGAAALPLRVPGALPGAGPGPPGRHDGAVRPVALPRLVRDHRITYVRMVAAMMRMVLDVPGLEEFDLSSVEALHHGAGPCPEQVKRAWLDLLGPRRVYEIYANQERVGRTVIRGDEWLEHPAASAARPTARCASTARTAHWRPPARRGDLHAHPGGGQPRYLGRGPRLPEREGSSASATSAVSTRTATCTWWTARATSSTSVAGTSIRPRSRRCCWACRAWPTRW